MRSNNSKSSPLSVWSVLFIILLILAILFYGFGEKIRATIISKEIHKITAMSTCNNAELKVFALGSSMFRTGIANRFESPNWLSDSTNLCIERTGFLNLSLICLNRNKSIIEAIANTKADIILIESPLIQYKNRSDNRFYEGRPRQTIRMLKQYVAANDVFPMDKYPKPFYNTQINNEIDSIEIENIVSVRELRALTDIKNFLSNLKKSAPEAKIIICDIPRLGSIESTLKQRDQILLEEYKKEYKSQNIDYWEFNQSMEKEMFFDIVHLNKNGQKVYMNWLINKLELETKH